MGFKRLRLQVICTSQERITVNGVSKPAFYAVYNTSTPHYPRGTNPINQQRTLVSLDLPPMMPCQGILTVKMYNLKTKDGKEDPKTGVKYDTSRFWYMGKGVAGSFITGISSLLSV